MTDDDVRDVIDEATEIAAEEMLQEGDEIVNPETGEVAGVVKGVEDDGTPIIDGDPEAIEEAAEASEADADEEPKYDARAAMRRLPAALEEVRSLLNTITDDPSTDDGYDAVFANVRRAITSHDKIWN